jgi:hypothetical protein
MSDKDVVNAFLFLGPPNLLVGLDIEAARHGGVFGEAASVFRANLEAALHAASIPYLMAIQAARDQRFHSILTAERIRARSEPADADERALEKARRRFDLESETVEGRKHLEDDVIGRLARAMSGPPFAMAAKELLTQTLVMVWGALEVLISDVVKCMLNLNPSLALKLVTSDPAKRHFRREVAIEDLAGHGFDLNRSMGDVLFADKHLDNLPGMKDVLSTLLPKADHLHSALAANELWILWQRRHLIVHRRGVVDSQFIANTGASEVVGSRLAVTSKDVDEALGKVEEIAIALLAALQAG